MIGSLDDFDRKLRHYRRNSGRELWPLVATISKQLLQEGIHPKQRRDHQQTAIPVLDIGRVNNRVQ